MENATDKIDPKDYASYEEYHEALHIHEEFIERATKATEVIQSAKTDEEMIKGMEALGFMYYEDDE